MRTSVTALLHGTMDVFPNAFLLAHFPGAAKMTNSGMLSMYWGLAFGLRLRGAV